MKFTFRKVLQIYFPVIPETGISETTPSFDLKKNFLPFLKPYGGNLFNTKLYFAKNVSVTKMLLKN